MRITCPNCNADYEVPASRLTPRKMVRCVRCQGEWVPPHVDEDAGPVASESVSFENKIESLPPVTAMDRLSASPSIPAAPPNLLPAWVLTVLVLVGAAAATVIWRDAVIQAWPQSALILAPFGQPMPTPAQSAGKTTG
ncbi:MAG TPA: zinc-ribbon domain-containing protein [Rhodopila sp.]